MKEIQDQLQLDVEGFDYHLPEEVIALHPVEPRSHARLWHVARNNMGSAGTFEDLPGLLPEGFQLWVNDTRVIRARLILSKPTGGRLELFLLEPIGMTMEQALGSAEPLVWRCLVRGAKRWRDGTASLQGEGEYAQWKIEAQLHQIEEGTRQVRFDWSQEGQSESTWGELLEMLGNTPLPPYMRRKDEAQDAKDYQTVYAEVPGSVAAPTAGLHYDKPLLAELSAKGTLHAVTLHVGAGTFKPLTEGEVSDHVMHSEHCVVPFEALRSLAQTDVHRVVTGTTTLRTLESLYWLALKWKKEGKQPMGLGQWEWAQELKAEALALDWDMATAMHWAMEQLDGRDWVFQTAIMMVPSYRIRSCQALVTNFHLPKSTLLCLVAAAIGDRWKDAYLMAMQEGFRFLSYGDGSYLEIENKKAR
ncbi:MAG: S-adenosylmethionine:tRNA ribosyltransferase-isomerase [Bacteroidetes bacterium]|nr:S-adenosylmethionine:tRNA ribosyltransferase-isomerase [Bacteroidota bacterium]